jgi:hypothetical protein
MVNGALRCIGTAQQLKSKFGRGYILELQLREHHTPTNTQKVPPN